MPKQQMTSQTRGVGRMLQELKYFRVPAHQRDYAWPIGAVEQFLEDVIGAMKAGDGEYFLGLIVLVDSDDPAKERYQILDGQQRLATTTMVYAAIRNWLRDRGMDEHAKKIEDDFIGISEIGEPTVEPRLILNLTNRELFDEVVIKPCPESAIKEKVKSVGRHSSERKLLEAALRCREEIGALAASKGPDQDAQAKVLFDLAKYLRDQVQVDSLDVKNPEDAYTIFESLNDRGIDLSVLDLLKNHIFREATPEKQEEVQQYWTTMLARLGDRRADDFIKVFWTSRYGRVQRGRLFKELKAKYRLKGDVLKLIKELSAASEIYANLEVSDSEIWKQHSTAAREAVEALAILGGKQTHPIIMAALERFSKDEMEKLLRFLVILIVRYQLIGRGRTGRLEIQAAAVAKGISSGVLKSANSVWKELRSLVPNDKEFEEDFVRYEETKAERARWLLRALEVEAWHAANPEKPLQHSPVSDPEKVNLEHVLPKNPSNQWADVLKADGTIVRECANRLGNLALLDKPSNKKKANGPFDVKVKVYDASDFVLTKAIANHYSKWDREAIENRQKRLAEIALNAWPV